MNINWKPVDFMSLEGSWCDGEVYVNDGPSVICDVETLGAHQPVPGYHIIAVTDDGIVSRTDDGYLVTVDATDDLSGAEGAIIRLLREALA